jgi:hypothetical protein
MRPFSRFGFFLLGISVMSFSSLYFFLYSFLFSVFRSFYYSTHRLQPILQFSLRTFFSASAFAARFERDDKPHNQAQLKQAGHFRT